jgi:hypothetical protein
MLPEENENDINKTLEKIKLEVYGLAPSLIEIIQSPRFRNANPYTIFYLLSYFTSLVEESILAEDDSEENIQTKKELLDAFARQANLNAKTGIKEIGRRFKINLS